MTRPLAARVAAPDIIRVRIRRRIAVVRGEVKRLAAITEKRVAEAERARGSDRFGV
jgi:hypothetical protein